VLVISFLAGILFHLYRDRIQLRFSLFLVALLAGFVLSGLPHGSYYLPVPATYITVYLGLLNPRKMTLVSSGDYSYGLYLYGYPLQQAVASYGPATHHWWINIGVALPAAFLIAVVSWHKIERPMLNLRRRLPPLEAMLVGWFCPAGSIAPVDGGGGRSLWQWGLGIVALLGGIGGSLLLINADEGLAALAVLVSFGAAVQLTRLGGQIRITALAEI
jgi:hypothetical protein